MARRHPHLNGSHTKGHGHGPEAGHPMFRPGDHHAFGGHEGQKSMGGGGSAPSPSREGSPADMAQDAAGAKSMGMSPGAYENTARDKREDAGEMLG